MLLAMVTQFTQGFYSPRGIAALSVALLMSAIATFGPRRLDRPIAVARRHRRDWLGWAIFAIVIGSQFQLGIWKVRSTPRPNNDVWVFHRDAAEALRKGINPYAITFPNIYHPDAWVYAPEVVEGDRLKFGYPYPPLTLLLTAAGHWLFGDARYTMLLAMTAAGVMIAGLRRDRIGLLIGAVFLCAPSYPFVLEMGWTEPIQACLLAGVALTALRTPAWIGVAMGLLIASKQYMPVSLLLLPLLVNDRKRLIQHALIAMGVAALVSLPFVIGDVKAFGHSVVTLQLHQPFRADALSYLNLWRAGREGWIGPAWVAFAAVGASIILCVIRRPGFLPAVAFVYFVFFAFNKQAFANYYYFVMAGLCIASAAETLNRRIGSTDKP